MAASLVLLAGTASAAALEADDFLLFSWEPVTLKPQLALSQVYNDNIFSRPGQAVSDFITTVSPGLSLLLGKRAGNNISLNYTLSQNFYADRSDLDATEHLVDLISQVEWKRFTLRGQDRVQFLSSPIGGEVKVLDPQFVDRPLFSSDTNIDRFSAYDSYTLNYRAADKVGVYVQGLHNLIDYEEGTTLFDLRTVSGSLGFSYQAFPKTMLFGEGYYGVTSADPNFGAERTLDVGFYGGVVGARGQFTPKISGTVRVGYEMRDFDQSVDSPATPVVTLGLSYAFSEKTEFNLSYSRRQDLSVQFASQIYSSDVISLQAAQYIGSKRKWRAIAGGYYATYDYERTQSAPARDYDVYTAYFNLAYQVQLWLTATLGYDRTSVLAGSIDTTSYDVNRFSLRLAIGY